jgi:predicted RNA binding protein YcfA (HicA-like mRNA interferase family)
MTRLPQVTSRELVRFLKAQGFTQLRQAGSHLTLRHETRRLTVTIPMHTGADIGRGLSGFSRMQVSRSTSFCVYDESAGVLRKDDSGSVGRWVMTAEASGGDLAEKNRGEEHQPDRLVGFEFGEAVLRVVQVERRDLPGEVRGDQGQRDIERP